MSINDTSGASATRPVPQERSSSTRQTVPDGRTDVADWLSIPGFDPGGGGVSSSSPPQRPDVGLDPGMVTPDPSPEQPPVHGERPCTQWVVWEAWFTQRDERVCPECGPLHGQWFRRGEGPRPPLHTGCRCERRDTHRECVARRAGGAGAGENF